MTSRELMPLVRGRSHSENLTFSAFLCEQSKTKKASDDETKNIAGRIPEATRSVTGSQKNRNCSWTQYFSLTINSFLSHV